MPEQVEDQPGVWVVAFRSSDSAAVTPFASEVEALRALNDDPDGKRVFFVPFGASLHEVVYPSWVIRHTDDRCSVGECHCGAVMPVN